MTDRVWNGLVELAGERRHAHCARAVPEAVEQPHELRGVERVRRALALPPLEPAQLLVAQVETIHRHDGMTEEAGDVRLPGSWRSRDADERPARDRSSSACNSTTVIAAHHGCSRETPRRRTVTATYRGLVRYIVTLESMRPRPGPILRAL